MAPKFFSLFDLGINGLGQTNVMIVRNTPSNGDALTYQISLPYLKRQINYGPDIILPLYDLGVKGQGKINVVMVRDTPSYDDVPKYHRLIFKGKQVMALIRFYLYLTLKLKVKVK